MSSKIVTVTERDMADRQGHGDMTELKALAWVNGCRPSLGVVSLGPR